MVCCCWFYFCDCCLRETFGLALVFRLHTFYLFVAFAQLHISTGIDHLFSLPPTSRRTRRAAFSGTKTILNRCAVVTSMAMLLLLPLRLADYWHACEPKQFQLNVSSSLAHIHRWWGRRRGRRRRSLNLMFARICFISTHTKVLSYTSTFIHMYSYNNFQ